MRTPYLWFLILLPYVSLSIPGDSTIQGGVDDYAAALGDGLTEDLRDDLAEDLGAELADMIDPPGALKHYMGYRVSRTSNRTVYYHGMSVAVMEIGRRNELLNCEVVQFNSDADGLAALQVPPLSDVQPHVHVHLSTMVEVLKRCSEMVVSPPNVMRKWDPPVLPLMDRLFLVPGSNWCGKNSLAGDFYALGSEEDLDKCCRAHDYCPVSINGLASYHGLKNPSVFTRSHCNCDENFYKCLKSSESKLADQLGRIFFNVLKTMCYAPPKPGHKKGYFRLSARHY